MKTNAYIFLHYLQFVQSVSQIEVKIYILLKLSRFVSFVYSFVPATC